MFVYRGHCILLLRRSRDDIWHIPAGVVEDEESFADAAERELKEETGLGAVQIENLGLPQSYPPVPPHEYPADLPVVTLENFVAEAPTDWEPRLDSEHTGHRWVSFQEAGALLYFENTKRAFALVQQRIMPDARRDVRC